MARADIVEVIVEDVIAANVALGIDHCVGVLLTVSPDVLTPVFKICVEHALQFDAHHIAPLGHGREVEEIALWHALHLRVGEPLTIVLVGHFTQDEGAVDEEVVEGDVACLATPEVARLNTIELAVLDLDVIDISVFIETDDLYTILRLFAGHILHVDVAHRRVIASATHLVVLVVEVDLQHALLADAHLDVLHVDVLDDTSATAVGFDAEYALQLGRVHHTVVGKHILASTGDLRADDHSTVTVLHLTVADDDVLRRHVALPAITVTATLDGNAVVAGVEETVLDEHAVAALRIATVAIGTVVDHLHTTHGDVCGMQRMDHPER